MLVKRENLKGLLEVISIVTKAKGIRREQNLGTEKSQSTVGRVVNGMLVMRRKMILCVIIVEGWDINRKIVDLKRKVKWSVLHVMRRDITAHIAQRKVEMVQKR